MRRYDAAMRFLGVGHDVDLGALYLRLVARGHEVRVVADDPASADVLRSLLTFEDDLERGLAWVEDAGPDGCVLFEGIGWGALQDRLRTKGVAVLGGSALGDRLEGERTFGQSLLADVGLRVAGSHRFDAFDKAIDFVRERKGRYVLKYETTGFSCARTYVGELDDGVDLIAALEVQRDLWSLPERPPIVLMERVTGVEVGVGAWFDGARFLRPANLDWEHKRFFPGDLGEMTGEMGTLVTYRGAESLFDATLARLSPALKTSGYVGYVNLNMIVNDDGPWPLELTCRFGYPGYAILGALHREPWDDVFARVLKGDTEIPTYDGWAIGVALTVPPFPHRHGYAQLSKGTAIALHPSWSRDDAEHLHWGEVDRSDAGPFVTRGVVGYVAVVTARGNTVEATQHDVYARARKVIVPNMRYRNDIGNRFLATDRRELIRLGWLAP